MPINSGTPISIRWLSFSGLGGKCLNGLSVFSALALIKVTLLDYTLIWWGPKAHVVATIVALIGLTVSILVHELGHSFFILLRRGSVAIEVSPGMGFAEPMDNRQITSFLVVISGPISSLALGLALIAMSDASHGFVTFLAFHSIPFLMFKIIYWLGVMNVVLAFTNLFPIWPLDGYRLGECAISRIQHYGTRLRAHAVMATLGMVAALLLFGASLFNPSVVTVITAGLFVGLSALKALECYVQLGATQSAET